MNAKPALTPPMGWNSFDCYDLTATEEDVLGNAEYMGRHLKQFGWVYYVLPGSKFNNPPHFFQGGTMRILVTAACAIAAMATRGFSANDTIYAGGSAAHSGANSGLSYSWHYNTGDTLVEATTGGVAGGKCLHMHFAPPAGTWAGGVSAGLTAGLTDLSGFTSIDFSIKGNINQGVFQLATYGAGQLAYRFTLPATSTYQSVSIPLSNWTADELATIGGVLIETQSPGGAAGNPSDAYLDNVVLVSGGSSVLPSSHNATVSTTKSLFPTSGKALISVFGMNGSLLSSYSVNVAAHSAVADVVRHDLSAGAHVVSIKGAGVSITQKIIR